MAGLIPLGGAARSAGGEGGGRGDQQINQPQAMAAAEIPWFWYSRSDGDDVRMSSAFKGMELWHPKQPQPQQQLHFFSQQQDLYASAAGLGVGPSGGGGGGGSGRPSVNVCSDESSRSRSGGGFTTLTLAGTSGWGMRRGISCQDCGNQAKKDCPHLRCRTCCKSRGFECTNHVKSTWVPAAKRRERQHHLTALREHHHQQEQRLQLQGEALKRPRVDPGRPNASGMELIGYFPADVSSPAMFQCVKVTSGDDPNEQFAYQTAVNIGGHVFRGILYDHGPDHPTYTSVATGDDSSGGGGGGGGGLAQPLDLIAAAGTAAAYPVTNAASVHASSTMTAPFVDPLSTYMAGTPFFSHS